MLGRLIPRDEGYFDLFNQLAGHLSVSARKLCELLAEPRRQAELVREIKDVEHRADVLMHGLTQRLDQSFVTPIDREDIHLLASRLDDVIDLVDGSARRAEMFNITDVREPASRLGDVLARAAAELEAAVTGMKRPEVVKERTRGIKQLEEEGDAIYHQAVGDLFRNSHDPIEVLKWKEMYDTLERTIDATQFAATALQSISIKHT
jgi:uncharacterized protein